MAYKIFFPSDFDFVKGGKLPGLFGGRPGCSGGDAGKDCFSTRFMVHQYSYEIVSPRRDGRALCLFG
jgi:hypothetical protein